MALHAESSTIPDSIMGSSPAPEISPVIIRSKNTYGRKRSIPDNDDSSFTLGDVSLISSTSSRASALQDGNEDVPPTSDAFDISEPSSATKGNDDVEAGFSFSLTKLTTSRGEEKQLDTDLASSPAHSEGSAKVSHQWGWKAKLAAFDADSESDNENTKPPDFAFSEKRIDSQESSSSQMVVPLPTQSVNSEPDNLFDGSLPTLTQSPPQSHFQASPSASPDMTLVKKVKRRIAVVDSDDDMAESSFNSPERRLHSINTPKSRSSPTPPTSDVGPSSSKTQSKGKSLARSVSPLVFSDDDARSKNLNKRKPPKDVRSDRQKIKVSSA